jgi:hypothetical protein
VLGVRGSSVRVRIMVRVLELHGLSVSSGPESLHGHLFCGGGFKLQGGGFKHPRVN